MKADIHPTLNPVIFVDSSTKDEIVTRSTLSSGETRDVDGVLHYVIKADITEASHPFYTGTQKVLDSAGRVERFKRKYQNLDMSNFKRR
jgi:large subunit ribosomal protein L31